ncbi:hypothetical protein KAR48_08275 [bacterium]|nr:hypothetical protein [bacterium]
MKYKQIILTTLLCSLFFQGISMGQGKKFKWLRTGSLHQYIVNVGAEYEMGRTDQTSEQQDGLRWPAQFSYQDNLVGKSMWIGTTDFFDPGLNQIVPHKIVSVGTRSYDDINEIMPYDFRMIGRFPHPIVIVDDEEASDNNYSDIVDEYNPDMLADRLIINKMHSYIGLDITRTIMQFSQQNHDNYIIYEYILKNTGIIDRNGTVDTKTLYGVVLHLQNRYGVGHESFQRGWSPNGNINWGKNCTNHVIGQDPNAADFRMRAAYAWYGPHSQSTVDDWGAPDWLSGISLGGVQYVGMVTLHADQAPGNPVDDPYQPVTTGYIGSDTGPQDRDMFNPQLMTRKYQTMTAGHPEQTHFEALGGNFADIWGSDAGGYSQGAGYGPYTLEPGDSIRIVIAEGVSGIHRALNYEIADKWFNDDSPFTLPNGSQSNDRDQYKRQWVQTGEDSLLQSFDRAIDNFDNDYDIPSPPPPPEQFIVQSKGNRIHLEWADNADAWTNFDGYRVYRAIGKPDTLYEEIFSCDAANVVHEYNDTEASRGFKYYYYVQTKDDGSTNLVNPGKPLVSSKFFTMTNKEAFLLREPGKSLKEFTIIPNPFNVRARSLQFESSAPDQIALFGLPDVCTLKIFTERGDLVNTIYHTNGSGDELWNCQTSSGQLVVSGVYIIHLEVTEDTYDSVTGDLKYSKGDHTYRKLVIIR